MDGYELLVLILTGGFSYWIGRIDGIKHQTKVIAEIRECLAKRKEKKPKRETK